MSVTPREDDPYPRLAHLLKMVIGATTDGEHLAALAALHRAMEAAGLDLHDIVGRFESDGTAAGGPTPPRALDDDEFARTAERAARYSDDVWPDLARWLCEQNEAWHTAHRMWLLNGNQRSFAQQQSEAALTIRPTPRQAAWLIALFFKASEHLAHPARSATLAIGSRKTVRAGDRIYPTRVLPRPNPKPQPQRALGRPDQVRWVAAVISARRKGGAPSEDATMPALFADAEIRVLAWLGAQFEGWLIDRSAAGKDDVHIERPVPGPQIAAMAQTSLRTVHRALAKARAAGYLTAERHRKDRGQPNVYRLTLPPEGLRHDQVPETPWLPRRQGSAARGRADPSGATAAKEGEAQRARGSSGPATA